MTSVQIKYLCTDCSVVHCPYEVIPHIMQCVQYLLDSTILSATFKRAVSDKDLMLSAISAKSIKGVRISF